MKRNLLKTMLAAVALALPIGAWATVNTVSSYKLWTFNTLNVSSYTGGAFPSNTTANEANTDLTGDGVIYTGNSGSSLQSVSPTATGLTLNGVALGDITQVIRLQETYADTWTKAFQTSSRTGETYNQTMARSLAINVTVPGTLYIKVKSNAVPTEGNGTRNFELLFNPNSSRTYPHDTNNYRYINTVQQITDTDLHELSVFGDGAGTFWFRAGKVSDVYAILFVPAYTLTTSVSPASTGNIAVETAEISSDYYSSGTVAGTKFYSENTNVTLTASPIDGYKFVDWTGVTSSDGTNATVTMSENKTVTATFAKKAVTTVWKFEQYVKDDEAILYDADGGASVTEYIDGLFFHSRDKKNTSHAVRSRKTKVTNADLETHFGTYTQNTDYMAALLGSGGGNAPTAANPEAGTLTTVDGISFKAPAAGKFYVTVSRSDNTTVYVYKNGTSTDNVTLSNETPAKEFEITVAAGDNIYVINTTSSGKQFYLWNAGFVPTAADETTKTVSISEAGYATFSSTKNYDLDGDLEAYIVSNVSETAATLSSVSEIPACTGVILKGNPGTYTLTSKETTTADVSSNQLKANIVDYVLPANDGSTNYNYTLAAGPTFMHSKGSGTLAAGKAFLRTTVNATTPAPVLNIAFGGSATGIEKVAVEQQANGVYYNLAGQRVAQPTKGLYIVNGKKVVIK